jgi:uncharacterized protein YjaZ
MLPQHEALGIPFCGGYVAGYNAVQMHLRKAGTTIMDVTKAFIDGEDIVKKSRYFSD